MENLIFTNAFIKSAILAKNKFGSRALVLSRTMLFRIDNIANKRSGRLKLKLTPLYSFRKGRGVRVKPTGFMRKATLIQANKLDILFKKEAEKRIKKAKL